MTKVVPIEVGTRFGRLTVVGPSVVHPGSQAWACVVCDCSPGVVLERQGRMMRAGKVQSCGCLRREKTAITGRRPGPRARGVKRQRIVAQMLWVRE